MPNRTRDIACKASRNTQYTALAWLLVSAAALYLATSGTAWAQSSAARVMAVSGQAKAIDAQGRERTLEKGVELFTGDRVQTLDNSLVQLRLHDGGYLSVRSSSELVLEQFAYDEKDPNKSNFLVSLLRGGFRSITGLIGRSNPNGYQIRAATATIGIRGTDHEPVLVLDTPDAQLQGQPPGLYDKVNDGETFITSRGVVLPLRRGDVGFAPLNINLPPQVLLKIPDFYRVELKTDARDPGDGATTDGTKSGTTTLLRPSVAARREAMAAGGGSGTGTGTAPAGSTNTAAPAPGTQTTQPTQPSQPTQPAPTTTTKPALTTEQKRAVLQAITPTPTTTTTTRTTTPTPTSTPK
jgi:hypothetical protein